MRKLVQLNSKKKLAKIKVDNHLYELPSNQNFGLTFAAIFLLVFIYFFSKESYFSYFFLFCSIYLLTISLFLSKKLENSNKVWLKFGLKISKYLNPIILGIIFYLLISPIALFFKLIKRDELKLKKSNHNSFWLIRSEKSQASSMKDQF